MKIPAKKLISLKNGARGQYTEGGRIKVDMCTCGTCGRSWNDALITDRTPAPSGRCPYEYYHAAPRAKRRPPSAARAKPPANDLLDAAERVLQHCALVHKHWGEGSNTAQANEAERDLRAAVAKARGRV